MACSFRTFFFVMSDHDLAVGGQASFDGLVSAQPTTDWVMLYTQEFPEEQHFSTTQLQARRKEKPKNMDLARRVLEGASIHVPHDGLASARILRALNHLQPGKWWCLERFAKALDGTMENTQHTTRLRALDTLASSAVAPAQGRTTPARSGCSLALGMHTNGCTPHGRATDRENTRCPCPHAPDRRRGLAKGAKARSSSNEKEDTQSHRPMYEALDSVTVFSDQVSGRHLMFSTPSGKLYKEADDKEVLHPILLTPPPPPPHTPIRKSSAFA